jgi:hypothetical protein
MTKLKSPGEYYMKKTIFLLFGLVPVFVFGQVQLFERGSSGIVLPNIGVFANPDIQEWRVGAEYNVEGKFAIGGYYSQPLSDTIFNDRYGIISKIIHPYLYFEVIEPDKFVPISLSLKASYRFSHEEKELERGSKAIFRQRVFSGGPIVGARFFVGKTGIIIPHAGYEFGYVIDIHRDAGKPENKTHPLWHDINLGVVYNHMFNELLGVVLEPKVTVRIGADDPVTFFVPFHVGLVLRFI